MTSAWALLSLYLRTFAIGVAVAAPVGAMGMLCIQRVLSGGWRAGAVTGAGIATADGIYGGLAAFGLTALSEYLISFQTPLRIVGGVALLWLGVRAMRTAPMHDADKATGAGRPGSLYGSAVALTLTNPMTVMAFGAIFASAGLAAESSILSATVATMGVALGSFTWWIALATVVAVMRHAVSDGAVHKVNLVSGAVVVCFGLLAIGAGAYGVLA